jgi:hypothetical protein
MGTLPSTGTLLSRKTGSKAVEQMVAPEPSRVGRQVPELRVPKSINRYKFNFLKTSLNQKNTKKLKKILSVLVKNFFSNLRHLIG